MQNRHAVAISFAVMVFGVSGVSADNVCEPQNGFYTAECINHVKKTSRIGGYKAACDYLNENITSYRFEFTINDDAMRCEMSYIGRIIGFDGGSGVFDGKFNSGGTVGNGFTGLSIPDGVNEGMMSRGMR